MRDDERFEIERAYDLLPHVVGASWASIYFRLNKIKNPTVQEFRDKVAEYFSALERLGQHLPDNEQFLPIKSYIRSRHDVEIRKILDGENPEVEKRYKRYIDYG